MGHFDEVCFLCGVSPIGPTNFSSCPDLTAEDLATALLEYDPDILSAVPTCETQEDLAAFLEAILTEDDPENFDDLSAAFGGCIAIGYFDHDGDTPRKSVNDPAVKFLFPDGRFVKKRSVGAPECGEFQTVYWGNDSATGGVGVIHQTNEMSRTGAYFQGGFGNFFLSGCCFRFLEGWIERDVLPPMWDGRQLSFIGELWEILNSREDGRRHDGCLEWLEPGGAEQKLEQTQYELATSQNEIYPEKTAEALQSGCDEDGIKKAIYDDYGYWMFVSPHEWPEVPEGEGLVEMTALGLDVPSRASQTPFSLGCLSGLAIEILHQIFRHLPSVATYLSLKLVCKGMHDLVTDTKFAYPVLREIIGPDPTREMFWIHPLENQPREMDNFINCLNSWLSLKCPSTKKESFTARDILSHRDFPLVQFIYSLYTSDYSRNRRRLWESVKQFEEVWSDYRVNGWEVNRFGLPYTERQE